MKPIYILNAILAGAPCFCTIFVSPRHYHEVESLSNHGLRNIYPKTFNQVRSTDLIISGETRRRASSQHVGAFGLAGTVPPGLVLSVGLGVGIPDPVPFTSASVGVSISASCLSCFTTGSGTASTPGITSNDTILEDIEKIAEELVTDPTALIQSIFGVELDFVLSNFSGHFEFDVTFAGSGSFDVSIPIPPTPVGGTFPPDVLPGLLSTTIGLVPTIDIVFTVSGAVSLLMGFEFSFPEEATFTIDAVGGKLISTNFGEAQLNALPIQFKSGSGSVSAKLRLGAKLAFDFNVAGNGFKLESGVFLDIPTYSAAVTFNPNATCELAFTEQLDIDAGVFATAGVQIDLVNFGVGPSDATTFASLPLPGTCLASSTTINSNATLTTPTLASATAKINTTTTEILTSTVTSFPSLTSAQPTLSTPTSAQIIITSPLTASSLATPIIGAFIVGTPVVGASSVGSIPFTPPVLASIAPSTSIAGLVTLKNSTAIKATSTSSSGVSALSTASSNSTATGSTLLAKMTLAASLSNDAGDMKMSLLRPLWILGYTSLVFVLFL